MIVNLGVEKNIDKKYFSKEFSDAHIILLMGLVDTQEK